MPDSIGLILQLNENVFQNNNNASSVASFVRPTMIYHLTVAIEMSYLVINHCLLAALMEYLLNPTIRLLFLVMILVTLAVSNSLLPSHLLVIPVTTLLSSKRIN